MNLSKGFGCLFFMLILCFMTTSLLGQGNGNQALRLTIEDDVVPFPEIFPLPNGKLIFKIAPVQKVGGDLIGSLAEKVCQVTGDPGGVTAITTLWTLETSAGKMEGYCSGDFHFRKDGTATVIMQGEVLSVTSVYAEYYQAIVHYRYILQLSNFDLTGTFTIFPREKR